jgi:class 3 adenylate cyclase/WD40 repeat protein/type II secretory pathway pseudopilin PulG
MSNASIDVSPTSGPVTFLFCDLVGSTELLARLGNEASEEARRRYFAALREAIFVTFGEEVKGLGDGLMAAFRSSPSDALACAAAIHAGMGLLNREQPPVRLQVRIGIATGEAVWAAEERDWFGLAVNTAARLCAATEPDQVLIAASGTAALAGRARPLGDRMLKGLADPVPTWEAIDAALLQDPALPLAVGVREGPGFADRPAEVGQLRKIVGGCESAGRYQRAGTLLIVGDAGVGKTRLVRQVLTTMRQPDTVVLYGRASLSDADPLAAVREAVRGYVAGLTEMQLDGVLSVCGPDVASVVPAVRLRRPDLPVLVAADPRLLSRALAAVVEYAARTAAVVVVIDDLHHAGGPVVDALEELAVTVPGRVLVVGVGRPDGSLWTATAARLRVWPVLDVGPVERSTTCELLADCSDLETESVDEIQRRSAGHVGTIVDIADRLRRTDPVASAAAISAGSGPYRGLAPFLEDDADYFFGRTGLIDAVVDRLGVNRVIGILGVSGSGKSSLARAGLVPRLRADTSADAWQVVVMTPGRSPFTALASALSGLPHVADTVAAVDARLRESVDGLDAIGRTLAPGRQDRLLVVVDQLEELFTEATSEDRKAFADLLCHAAMAPGGPVSLCVTLRADFYGRLTDLPVLAAAVHANHVLVGSMSATEIRDAVELPSAVSGYRLEPGLADAFVQDASGQVGALPLLSHALRETWRRRHGRTLTLAGYRDAGRLQGAISRTADRSLDALDGPDRDRARQLFLRLVTPGEGSSDTRRQVDRTELSEDLNRLVDHFVAARLVTVDDSSVQIAHEALITEWPRLRNWLDEDREGLRSQRHLTDTAATWAIRQHDPAELYRGARLQAANDLVANGRASLNETEAAFLAASTQRQRASARRTRRVVVGLALLTVLSAVAAGFAVQSQRRARSQQREAETQKAAADAQRVEADRQRGLAVTGQAAAKDSATKAETANTGSQLTTLASRSLSLRSSQRDLAALLAVEAYKRRPDAVSKSALFGSFTIEPGFLGYLLPDGAKSLEGISIPGSTDVLLASFKVGDLSPGPIQRIDLFTGKVSLQLDTLPLDGPYGLEIEVGGNGKYAAFSTQQNDRLLAGVFDLSTGHLVGPPIRLPEFRPGITVDPTGSTVWLPTDSIGQQTAFDTRTGAVVATIAGIALLPANRPYETAGVVTYGPDGKIFIGSLGDRLRVFDPRTFAQLDEIPVPLYSTAGLIKISADGSFLVARGIHYDFSKGNDTRDVQSGVVARIDLRTKSTVWQVSGSEFPYGECFSFAFDEPTGRLWCGNYFGLIHERSLTTGAKTGRELSNQHGWIQQLSVVPTSQGRILVGFGNNSGSVARWQIDGGGAIGQPVAAGHTVIGQFDDGKTLLVAQPNGGVAPFDQSYAMWDSVADKEGPAIPPFAFARVNHNSVVGTFADNFEVGSYNLETQKRFSFPVDFRAGPTASAGTADGAYVAIGFADGHASVWENATGRLITTVTQTINGQPVEVGQVALSDDHSRLFIAGSGFWIYELPSGKEVGRIAQPALAGVTAGAGRLIVANINGTLALYDPTTAQKVQELPPSIGFMGQRSLSSDGNTLLGEGNDGSVSLYDLPTGSRLGDPFRPADALGGPISLRGDGMRASTMGPTGTVGVLWDLNPDHWVSAACALAGRNLTQQEWTTYVGDLGLYRLTCPDFAPA